MSIERHSSGIYRSSLLASLSWLDHGFGTALADPSPSILTLRQIHSAHVHRAADWSPALEGDALIADQPQVWVGVKTADCVPILLADIEHRVVAAVHCGWRGTVAGVATACLARMRSLYGTRAEAIVAALGPAIGSCCYEVGPEVAVLFTGLSERAWIDLTAANVHQLLTAGVPARQIDQGAPCSACHPAELHSFRRDRERAGRMVSAIAIK